MEITAETRARLDDASRFPKTEVEALTLKVLLQFRAESDYIDAVYERLRANESICENAEQLRIQEMLRLVHLEFVKLHPQFKYSSELSYQNNPETMNPQFQSVNVEGHPAPFAVDQDFKRDAVINDTLQYLFKYHTNIYGDGLFEFSWEKAEFEHEVGYVHEPDAGQMVQ